ncbi:carbamate kinase [Spiroplasma sabaudiense Ar-1343]|uniref:Carbamate kinase n=1 Tax=Spiroplasma sabaudiense Ar-1343 TaxID=1276257 RepID=W6AA83_9MOLU|nr:carbamate kinase [Spiroplasma sabaudiense]AHI53921.1 carbamate kinase [Spiroplasma sabaudiense Ar-1343]
MSKIVVAIGGNALGDSPEEQKQIVKNTAKHLANIIASGNQLVIVHGNGPQVGMINLGFDIAHKTDSKSPVVDFPECGSMSEGYIGYHLQQALKNELNHRKIKKSVVSIITQTLVDKNDLAFKNPSKPIGSFYDQEMADKLSKENNWNMKEDSGRGWRRVIASPKPIDIVEKDILISLVDSGFIPIAAGGGGIPVFKENESLTGIAAVIDKDFAAAKVAELIGADQLIILTAVDNIMINFNQPNQEKLTNIKVAELEKYILDNQFASGSMLPKVEAAISFVKQSSKNVAVIGNLEKVADVIKGISGTKINN